ncbi:MAG: hypothetical protein LUG18_12845 [Candidatus Azobacteroides sp.]|nr:hypothetical protein [Candidatus Azobacteroides sp.]
MRDILYIAMAFFLPAFLCFLFFPVGKSVKVKGTNFSFPAEKKCPALSFRNEIKISHPSCQKLFPALLFSSFIPFPDGLCPVSQDGDFTLSSFFFPEIIPLSA